MRFLELLPSIQAGYPEQPRAFHVLATRYYIGADTLNDLKRQAVGRHASLTDKQVAEIIRNR